MLLGGRAGAGDVVGRDPRLVDDLLAAPAVRATRRAGYVGRRRPVGVHHATSTCRMGDVVDDDGLVDGFTNVHVVDASVFPDVPRANTYLPTLMLAERLAARLVGRCRVVARSGPWGPTGRCTTRVTGAGPTSSATGRGAGATPGWSSATATSLLVDTLFDLRLHGARCSTRSPVARRRRRSTPSSTPTPTATTATATSSSPAPRSSPRRRPPRRWPRSPPAMLAGLNAAPGDVGELFRSFFGDFDFDGIELTPPTRTFDGRLDRRRRRPRGRADRGRPGAHQGRRASSTCPTPGRCSPATSCSSAARRSCGPARCRTGSPRAT